MNILLKRQTLERLRRLGRNRAKPLRNIAGHRTSRDKLVEIRVQHEARYSSADYLPLLFDAGLSGFPDLKAGTRQVTVQLP